ncbi:MAG: hypothetical protein AAF821_10855 [Cyanobacteria bacterium P01_D01_bin.156]
MGVLSVIRNYKAGQHVPQRLIQYAGHTAALLIGTVTLLNAQLAGAEPVTSGVANVAAIQPLLAQTASVTSNALVDGIYLFGEKPLPDQLQTAYMIFEARAGQVVGAFYAPHSSFDCFRGDVQNTQLSLAITETYSQEIYPYALDLDDTAVAGPGGQQFEIEGFHQIDGVSDNDMRMLGTCQAHYSQTI